jgi:hypothetical protein
MVPMPADLVALVADLIPRPTSSGPVEDWPQDERDYYRDHRGSFTACNRELGRMRQEKAARAILAALRIEPGHRPAGAHDHSSTDPWSYAPGGDTAYVDGCPVTPLTPED